MRTIFLTIFLLLHLPTLMEGQCVWDNNRAVNTPLASTINLFDWTGDKYYIYTRTNQTIPDEIWSPFSNQNNPSDNITHFIVSNPADNAPSEGWELLQKNFGSPNDPNPNPVIILYNRYSSIMRVFIYVPQSITFDKNTAKIDIKFEYLGKDKVESALLSPLAPRLQPISTFKKGIVGTTIQRTKYQGLFWMYADIPVAYDPCTCTQLSTIQIRPIFIDVQEVNLVASVQKKT